MRCLSTLIAAQKRLNQNIKSQTFYTYSPIYSKLVEHFNSTATGEPINIKRINNDKQQQDKRPSSSFYLTRAEQYHVKQLCVQLFQADASIDSRAILELVDSTRFGEFKWLAQAISDAFLAQFGKLIAVENDNKDSRDFRWMFRNYVFAAFRLKKALNHDFELSNTILNEIYREFIEKKYNNQLFKDSFEIFSAYKNNSLV